MAALGILGGKNSAKVNTPFTMGEPLGLVHFTSVTYDRSIVRVLKTLHWKHACSGSCTLFCLGCKLQL